MKRLCTYCKKMTEHEWRKKQQDFRCLICGSISINIQGIHEALM